MALRQPEGGASEQQGEQNRKQNCNRRFAGFGQAAYRWSSVYLPGGPDPPARDPRVLWVRRLPGPADDRQSRGVDGLGGGDLPGARLGLVAWSSDGRWRFPGVRREQDVGAAPTALLGALYGATGPSLPPCGSNLFGTGRVRAPLEERGYRFLRRSYVIRATARCP